MAAAMPVFLYWVSLFTQSDFFAAKMELRGIPRVELPGLGRTLKDGWFYIVALVVLVYVIFALRMEALAPYYATATLLILANFKKETRLNLGSIGTAHGLSGSLTRLGGDHMFLLLIIGALTSFLLGIGLTISACYIFLAMLLAPALVDLGINEMSAHLFLVYWGSVSYITPPVALAAYAAASIGGANPMKTAFQAVKLGFVSLLVPFFFVYNPALVGHGTIWQVFSAMATASFGIILLSSGFEGYIFFLKRIAWPVRIIFMVAGFLIFHPKSVTDFIGFGLVLCGVVIHFLLKKSIMKPGADTE